MREVVLMKRFLLLAFASGFSWALIAYILSFGAFGNSIVGGLAVSPWIGLLVAVLYRPIYKFPRWVQALLSVCSLYVAVTLFGVAVGVYDAMRPIPNRESAEVIGQMVIVAVLGVTITGLVLILWPLAFLNHQLLKRTLAIKSK